MKRLDKFLIRFFVGTLILLCLVIADKYQYIDLDEYKEKISNNINPLNLINKINGKLEIVDLGTEEEISVSSNYKEYHIIDENIRRYEDLKPLFDLYRKYKVYLCPKPVVQINLGYSSASKARTDIQEDFLAYIDFKGKSFWECMCLFAFFLGERNYYSEQCRRIYSSLYHRYDLLLIYKLISLLKKKPFLRKKIGFS